MVKDKLTSIAELKQKVEGLGVNVCLDCGKYGCQNSNHTPVKYIPIRYTIALINEFETGLKERLQPKNFFEKEHPAKCTCTLCCIAKQIGVRK